ncbi:UNVERIFIED_CONTAM: hypothetical protein FKN15_064025 [Acipenser sinensis]
MVDTIKDLGNPFSDDSKELSSLMTKDIANVSVVKTVNEIKEHVIQIKVDDNVFLSTDGQDVLCVPACEKLSQLSPCSHEEADTRIILHFVDAANKGHKRLRTVDTDAVVVVLAIAEYHQLSVNELWIAFGTGNKFMYLPAHQYVSALGPRRSATLPFFLAITGCDTMSGFAVRGKKTTWDVWISYDDATASFLQLAVSPDDIPDDCLAVLERFIVLLYDRTSGLDKMYNMLGRPYIKVVTSGDKVQLLSQYFQARLAGAGDLRGTCIALSGEHYPKH